MTSLSNSILWQRMQDYYDHMGPEVWQEEVVPLQITSNKYLAKLYARLIFAQMLDYNNQHDITLAEEPFHIVEIGAGHGKFGFYLLRALYEALAIHNMPKTSIAYIMTDISEKSISSWEDHPALKQYIDDKVLDFAFYNAIEDNEIKLRLAKKNIQQGQLAKPLFVICNYVFDTLPHDAFQVVNGKLHETELLITNKATTDDETEIKDYFENAVYTFKHNPISTNYYADHKQLNSILSHYEDHFENASFLIPIGGIQCIEKLKQFTSSHMNLLLADKGVSDTELFAGLDDPDITLHGSVSLMVNFDAIDRYIKSTNGVSMLMGNKSADFQIASFIINNSFKMPYTLYAFNDSLAAFSPQDLFHLCYKDDEPNKAFGTLDDVLAILNLADWDPNIFYDYHLQILNHIEQEEITTEQELALTSGVEKVWDYFFKLEQTQDLPFAIGAILYNLDYSEKALKFYQYSLEHFGMQEETLFNMALAYQSLEDYSNALLMTNKTLEVNANYHHAKELLSELMAHLEAPAISEV